MAVLTTDPDTESAQVITDPRTLAADLEAGCKPAGLWRIGTEHEKFVFRLSDLKPVPYDGEGGIGAVLNGLTRFGWAPKFEGDKVIALKDDRGGSITLEPGGQFELSGAPLKTIHQTCDEVHEHLRELREVNQELGIGMLGLGFNPKWAREDTPWMPKGRYAIMRRYMPTKGNLGLDMMTRTCTVQVNLDFSSEADMVRKLRGSLALQPISTALFANSPFTEGCPNGFQSVRSHIWTDTDPDRTGDLPFVFENGFGFERYVDYLLDTPMYFIERKGRFIDVSGQSFRDFMDGRLPGLPGERPTLTDWHDHATTVFPEVRLKRFIEMRGADSGPWRSICALPALWVGLLYDDLALSAAESMVSDWSEEERALLRRDVPRLGLDTPFRDQTVRDLARTMLSLSRAGLERRGRKDGFGGSEAHFVGDLERIVETGETPASQMLRKYHEEWGESVDPVYQEYAY